MLESRCYDWGCNLLVQRKGFDMRKAFAALVTASAAALLITGCATTTPTPEAPPGAPPATDTVDLQVAEGSLGQMVVDGDGMTVYVFDNDVPDSGSSSCTGACTGQWPAVTVDDETPVVEGVNGTVGTIPTPDGRNQVTLNGWPLYTFTGDSAAGDTAGQGVNDVWWIVDPEGMKVTQPNSGEYEY